MSHLASNLDIIHNVADHRIRPWDYRVRPLPTNSRLCSLHEAINTEKKHDAIIAHNMTDLLTLKGLPVPKILVLHATIDGRMQPEDGAEKKSETQNIMRLYLQKIGGHPVAVSPLKARSWNSDGDIVVSGADPDHFAPWSGEVAAGLRVANQITVKKNILNWDLHQTAFGQLAVKIVGNNPDMTTATVATSWQDLKQIMSQHRFFIHTANPEMEDGFNMAMIEAMAAGLPVVGNRNPSSPIIHGINGFLSDDPAELHNYGKRLIADKDLAKKMGLAAQATVREKFPLNGFCQGFAAAIERAKAKYRRLDP